jgi:GT2 family glycosyltransferase
MMPLVFIVLVNYRGYKDTVECINSLEKIDYGNYKIIVVDNASGDHSFERLKEEFPKHIIFEAADNLGFSGGNNIGIKYALENNAEYVLLLNNDTTVEPHFLNNMVATFEKSTMRKAQTEFERSEGVGAQVKVNVNVYASISADRCKEAEAKAETIAKVDMDADVDNDMDKDAVTDKETGIVGGKILQYGNDNIISHAGGYIDLFRCTTLHYGVNALRKDEQFNTEKEVGFISGCMMLIKKDVFTKIGLLNEEYFMYYEDTDFCLSATNKGYRLVYCPEAEIYHKVSMSSGGEDSPFFLKWNTRNRLLFMNKFRHESNSVKFALSSIYIYATRFIRMFLYSVKGDSEKSNAIRLGLIEGRKKLKEIEKGQK